MFIKGKKIHLIGIKGVGMTALAQILVSRGCRVTGSDGPAVFFTDAVLRRLKIPFAEQFAASNIPADVDIVVSSAAYFHPSAPLRTSSSTSSGQAGGKSLGNVEVSAALEKKLTIMTYPQAIGELAKEYQVIAVAGSHGKSTTTALLGWILEKVKLDPNVMVGTKVNKWESNARTGKSEYLIVEADEYREAFLNYQPAGVVLTSIDWDHPDYFPTKERYYQAFEKLISNIKPGGWLVAHGAGAQMQQIIGFARQQQIQTTTYGFAAEDDVFVADKGIVKHNQMFHIMFADKRFGLTSVPFPGTQYILNSAAALAAARLLGGDFHKVLEAVKTFPGTARRLEIVKHPTKAEPAIIIDDYAHHPTAIEVTLAGISKLYPGQKIVAVFQPHMFSRTAALLDAFAKAFSVADEVGLMEIYPSARETSGPVSGKDLAQRAKQYHEHVTYLADIPAAKHFVKQFLKTKTVIVLMGAGDVNTVATGL